MNRDWGSKAGSGGVPSNDRRERLRILAQESFDITKDPYVMRNHLGSYDCKLCLTNHNNEGNYMAHTQGKRHQTNLARRAKREAMEFSPRRPFQPVTPGFQKITTPHYFAKIGRPGYTVTKQQHPESRQLSLLFQIEYPEISEGLQPRFRFMSSYEQKMEIADKNFQYVLFAAAPYETVAFKIPSKEIEQGIDTLWDPVRKTFKMQLFFKSL